MEEKHAYTYILASKRNGTLYTGVTSNLKCRLYEHKNKTHTESFSVKYTVNILVWDESGEDIHAAIELEKKIKNRSRAWKIALIEKNNPNWKDLSLDFMDSATTAAARPSRRMTVVGDVGECLSQIDVIPRVVAESSGRQSYFTTVRLLGIERDHAVPFKEGHFIQAACNGRHAAFK
ncbi:MAG: GIY-YIG nuclease family protein [Desulfobulbus oligotrophicus]|jgi:putative endonuclease|nr:GIY-YIG nuclease family protein [Desulfobulbus oligotrophicus]